MSDVLELLSTAEQQRLAGQLQTAEQTCRRAVHLDPANPAAQHELGLVLGSQGKFAEAVNCFEAAVAAAPGNPLTLSNLGLTYRLLGRLDEAALAYQRAVRAKPDDAAAHYGLGMVLTDTGRLPEAIACYRRAVQLDPTLLGAYASLGVALERCNQLDDAAACFREVLRRGGDTAEAHSNLGGLLGRQLKLDEAAQHLRRAVQLDPNSPQALSNLGLVLERLDQLDEARSVLQQAVALAPNHVDVHLNLAMVLDRLGDFDRALAAADRALELDPNCERAHFSRAIGLLRRGQFEAGWPEYEWRAGIEGLSNPTFSQPRFSGQPLTGKTLLLTEEQGRGDTIHFVRYAELIRRQGATVILQCRPELVGILQTVRGIDRVVAVGDDLPDFDFYLPLPGAPGTLGTTLETIPADVPYLLTDPQLSAEWQPKIDAPGKLKVGIAWQGAPANRSDRFRSVPPAEFARLCDVPGVQLYSLQVGAGSEELGQIATPPTVVDLTTGIRDFRDTAAIVEHLDLVIACDTAVVHLAGAMAVDVWIAVAVAPDWRWLLDRADSPWYPTLRIYRQSVAGDWSSVFARICDDLAELAARA